MHTLTPGSLTLAELRTHFYQRPTITLANTATKTIDDSAQTVTDLLNQQQIIYGINTGFGILANTCIAPVELSRLQNNIILSHATGVGSLLDDAIVSLMLLLKINSLARGFSGIRRQVIDGLITLYNRQIYPCIPSQGSVGASGDLAPLAHMALVLIGQGKVRIQGHIYDGAYGLQHAGLKPLTLAPKEGLALLNGTQTSTAIALAGLFAIENSFASAIVSGSLSLDAALGSIVPFAPAIHEIRGHQSQIAVARSYRDLLAGSDILASHVNCSKVQDPYSLRCQPQVMGACLAQMQCAAQTLTVEANAVSDNPIVFSATQQVLSGGNFHAQPVAFAADNLALACAEIGSLAERRIALLVDSSLSGLPAFLVKDSGLNSGFMLAQVTAAALACENKALAHPCSVDSLPTSANQEDHVSMATYAARRLLSMADNTANIIAIELLAACQGIEFRRPLQSSTKLEQAHAKVRQFSAAYDHDRYLADEIAAIWQLVKDNAFSHLLAADLLPSQLT